MAEERDRLEVERLTNLVQGFGWKEIKREETDQKIIVTLERAKTVTVTETGAGAG